MHGMKLICGFCLSVLIASIVLAQQPPNKLTNEDVLRMVEAKLDEQVIIGKIQSSSCAFDTSVDALLKLKSQGVSDSVVRAMIARGDSNAGSGASSPAKNDPDDPQSPHDPGLYVRPRNASGPRRLIHVEPAAYSASASPGFAKVKWKAVLREAHAQLQLDDRSPEFWFYFEDASHGLSPVFAGASSPNEFVLAKMQEKKTERELMVAKVAAYHQSTGIPSEDVVQFDFTKTASGAYKVVPRQALAPGEYCLFYQGPTMGTNGKMFDFGIRRGQ